ncbi:sulfotransferase 1A1-like [Pecten maximus]|uniref:sulfotransferase 1A1-like n=1 Tax=Pecten maximus TaxID=6579 RepID=UPI001458589C|nr:sulfotransferase 1A1-like [Pecten maximus]
MANVELYNIQILNAELHNIHILNVEYLMPNCATFKVFKMKPQTSTDSHGNTLRFKPYKGLKFHPDIPGNVEDQLKDVSSLHLRPDDVLLCSFPKSEYLKYQGTPYMIEFHPSSEIDQLDSPRALHTHLTYPLIPAMTRQGKVKIVHVLRNPKDTIVYYYEHYKRVNLYGTITRLVEFLQLNRPESFLCEVKRAVEFANLQKEHDTKAGETKIWNSFGNGGRLPIYRKGCVGDWKNYFTVAQNERLDAMFNKEITEYGIDLNFLYE